MNARFRSGSLALILLATLLLAGVSCPRSTQADPAPDTDINIFYDALAPYGDWVDHGTYGRVWHPRDMPPGWRPYTDGHWDYSYEHGWVWVSDWVWGWAPFHYGRWAWDDWYGWIWVPGRIWAPAWVFWRYGGGYAAWAPMPPTVIWQPQYGLITRHFSYDRDLDWDCWVTVPEYYISHRHIRRHIIEPHRNIHVLNGTNNYTQVTIVNNAIVNQGIPVERIEKVSRHRVRSVRLREVERAENRGGRDDKGTLRIFRPRIRPASPEEIHRDEALAVKWGMEREARRRSRPSPQDARFDRQEIRTPDRLKEKMPSGRDVNPKPTMPERESQPFNGADREPAPIAKPEKFRAPKTRPQKDGRDAARRPDNRMPDGFEHRGIGRLGVIQRRDIGQTRFSKPRKPVEEEQTFETIPPNNAFDLPGQPAPDRPDPIRPHRAPSNKAQPMEAPGPGDQPRQFRRREPRPPENRGRLEDIQQQQMEIRRRQAEQAGRARKEAQHYQQIQEQQARQQLQQQRQIEIRRQQAEQGERAREEVQRRQQMQEQQARQQLQQQRQMDIRRQQAEQAERVREGVQHRPQMQEQQLRHQQLHQQRQMEIPRRQGESLPRHQSIP